MATILVRCLLGAIWIGFFILILSEGAGQVRVWRDKQRERKHTQKMLDRIEEYRRDFS